MNIKFLQKSIYSVSISAFVFLLAGPVSAADYETYNYDLTAGNNFVAITLETKATAKTICENSENVSKISKWNDASQSWKEYNCSVTTKQPNFKLLPNRAYMVTTTAPETVTIKGTVPSEYDVTFELGLNAVGVPNAEDYDLQAEELCGNLVDSEYQVVEISRFLNGGWDTHLCSAYYNTPPTMNNFNIQTGVGYLLKVVPQE